MFKQSISNLVIEGAVQSVSLKLQASLGISVHGVCQAGDSGVEASSGQRMASHSQALEELLANSEPMAL